KSLRVCLNEAPLHSDALTIQRGAHGSAQSAARSQAQRRLWDMRPTRYRKMPTYLSMLCGVFSVAAARLVAGGNGKSRLSNDIITRPRKIRVDRDSKYFRTSFV